MNKNQENNIIIFDTTLRDGEQAPGASMSIDEKVLIASLLEEMQVDIIEAGFAAASNGHFKCIQQISSKVKNSVVCSLARAIDKDITLAFEAIKHAPKKRIHTFIATSDIHLEYKLKMTKSQVLQKIAQSVSLAKSLVDDVEWSAEDAIRTQIDFLYQCVEIAIKNGATTINIPDTVGYTTPFEMFDLITKIKNNVPNIDQVIISVHCHNDLGLAVANSLAAVNAGATQVECTINGIGERAGNTALEEIVMSLKTRKDIFNKTTKIKTTKITHISRLVSNITGFIVQKNKAIVGKNAFAHEAGIHQDGILKNPSTYEIMLPEDIGLSKSNLVLGKHSGRNAFNDKLKKLGIDASKEELNELFITFKNLADQKKHITDDDIINIVDTNKIKVSTKNIAKIKLVDYLLKQNRDNKCWGAEVTLLIDGKEQKTTAIGNGLVNAIFESIAETCNIKAILKQYTVHAVSDGMDSVANVTLDLKYNNRTFGGFGSDVDTLKASAKAYINGLNKIIMIKRIFKMNTTLFDKIWQEHTVEENANGFTLLYIDRHLIHEVTSAQAFSGLKKEKRKLHNKKSILAVMDHNVSTDNNRLDKNFVIASDSKLQIETLRKNCQTHKLNLFDMDDARQGIVHIVGPEQGFALPGITLVCGDSHTSTHGAFGAISFGIGTSEVEQVFATNCLLQKKPKNMRININGRLNKGCSAKDIILYLIGKIGTAGGAGFAIEFSGNTIEELSMEGRMTICNMSIEAGAKFGLIAPDKKTFVYIKNKPQAPKGGNWNLAMTKWSSLKSDVDAHFDQELYFDAGDIEPQVTWGTSPEEVLPINGNIPDDDKYQRSFAYMNLIKNAAIKGTKIDRVFIGSCTNARIEDLILASSILQGQKIAKRVTAMVVPGSGLVKKTAENMGLDKIFIKAGFDWRAPGCSMCLAMNEDKLQPYERSASTSNRNFEGRQGRNGRTHLMSPLMASYAAIKGEIADVREIL